MKPILITIPQDLPGLRDFVGSWVIARDPNIVIDVGPSSTVARLVDSLLAMGIDRVDYVLLTHIHLDHAGGIGELLDRFPTARVVCHEKGIRHLVDPPRLWEASLKTLGELARSYGPPKPIEEARCIGHTRASIPGLRVIETPGHAAHHLSYTFLGSLFSGEAAGVYYESMGYLRPASPPPFFLEEALASIERLRSLGDQPICYAHMGRHASSRLMLERETEQILRWKGILEEEEAGGDENLLERCIRKLLQLDPELSAFHRMSSEDQGRESLFLTNAVKGFLGYGQNRR
jgi:glyoxylase-like metal-dependent hydrolase (beta-lactamase superfamily II)